MDEAVEAAAQAVGALGTGMIGMAGMVMMTSNMNFQQSGQSTGNSPQPGTSGGGGSPQNSGSRTLSASLALVPNGLNAVAVFPPFSR